MPKDSSAEMPQITAYSMTVGSMAHLSSAGPMFDEGMDNPTYILGNQAQVWPDVDEETKVDFQDRYNKHLGEAAEDLKKKVFGGEEVDAEFDIDEEEEGMKKRQLRVVQIFIADRHPDVPLEKAVVYQSLEPFATDMTNQELYFTVDIMGLLAAHNAERVQWIDKNATKQAGLSVYLEEIRISDLDMQVTAFTEFV